MESRSWRFYRGWCRIPYERVIDMNKALIAPIVALALLLAKQTFGVEFDSETQNAIVDGVLALITLAGIFMHPNKKDGVKSEVELQVRNNEETTDETK